MNQTTTPEPTAHYIMPITIECRDCGDTELQFSSDVSRTILNLRCDECQQEIDSEAHSIARSQIAEALAISFAGERMRAVLRPDEIEITCSSCSEVAGHYSRTLDPGGLEGQQHKCEACGDAGTYTLIEPEGGDCFDAHIMLMRNKRSDVEEAVMALADDRFRLGLSMSCVLTHLGDTYSRSQLTIAVAALETDGILTIKK